MLEPSPQLGWDIFWQEWQTLPFIEETPINRGKKAVFDVVFKLLTPPPPGEKIPDPPLMADPLPTYGRDVQVSCALHSLKVPLKWAKMGCYFQ